MSSSEGLPPAAPVPGPVAAQPSEHASTPVDPVPEPAAAAPPAQTGPPVEVSIPVEASTAAQAAPNLSPEHIAEQIAVLDAVAESPLAEHVELYQRLHAALQSALAEIDGP